MSDIHPMAARGFARGAEVYARGRPGFPPAALRWLEEDLQLGPGKSALELGAGTGKFTTLLARTGAEVIAAEPESAMLERLTGDLPGVRPLLADARHLPLADGSVDVVICAQSFHWFATRQALAEIRRVLMPGGMLGLVWNVRDRSVEWVDQLANLTDRFEGDAPRYDRDEWRQAFPAPGFSSLREKSAAHLHTGSAQQVIVDRVASVSFVAALPEATRRGLLEEVRALIARMPDLAGKAEVSMPYVTKMFWCMAD